MPSTKSFGKMQAAELLRHLSKKLFAVSDVELAKVLGIKVQSLAHWRKEDTALSPLQVANAITTARSYAEAQAHSQAITPIVEFFPVYSTEAGRLGKKQTVFRVDSKAGKHRLGLQKRLIEAKSGLYIFYDTRGRALYAGQTKKQNIWREMNLAFNRDRSAQIMTLVNHPTNDVEFRAASEKVRQPTDVTLKLYDLAAYFSAFEVVPQMVDDLEALLVRAFPNDLLNFRMEKFGRPARKKRKIVAAAKKAKASLETKEAQ